MKSSLVLPLLVLGAAGNVSIAMAQSAGTFTATGNMTTPRYGHTAILLPNGKVLIAGGNASGAELYDPVTGAFTAIGSLTTIWPGGGVLLPDGRVLFVEGQFNFTGKAAVGFYDPITGTFNVAGSLATLTAVNSATLLNDGRVLLVGVVGVSPAMPSAELYDPVAETSSPVANSENWPTQIPAPPAALLDGRVLLKYYEDWPELYDPTAGTFSVISGLRPIEVPPQATLLLNGEILLTGGSDNGFPANVNWASLLDPATGRFGGTGMMETARDGHTATLLPDGTVLVAGGSQNQANAFLALPSAELYDPAAGRFSAVGNMTTARAYHTATLLNNGQVLITGGTALGSSPSISAVSSAEIYTPAGLIPAPALFSLSGDGRGQGAIWHSATGQAASPQNPAVAGEALSLYTTSLSDGGVIPPQVAVGGRLAEILFFGAAPGYPGYYQVNFRVPNGIAPGAAVPVRLTYIDRPSNEVTMAAQ